MRYILLAGVFMVIALVVYKANKSSHEDQYTELFECYDKKHGYYNTQQLLTDAAFDKVITFKQANILHNQIDSLHKIEANKIDSLNKIIDGK